MKRRGFMAGILAAGTAPMLAKAGFLMPVRAIALAPSPLDWLTATEIALRRNERIVEIAGLLRETNKIIEDMFLDTMLYGSAKAFVRFDKPPGVLVRLPLPKWTKLEGFA